MPDSVAALQCRDTQRQLNCLSDPISRLPVEIWSEIFILCLPDSGSRYPDLATAPLLLLRICSAWANIARSTPALWDTLYVEFLPRAEPGFEHLFDSYLTRSRSRGLALTLRGYFDEGICALLCGHAHRMQQLGSNNNMLPSAFLNLRALTLYNYIDDSLQLMTVLRMMRAFPGLVECRLLYWYCDDSRADSLTLPCLQSLSVGEGAYESDLHILKYLSLPALRTLTISSIDLDEVVLISFLARLEAPLQSVRIDFSDTAPQFYIRLLNLVPTLTCLWLSWHSASECTLFLNLLGGSPHGFLPQVRNLTFSTNHLEGLDFDALYNVLSARRSQLTSFRFIHDRYNRLSPPPSRRSSSYTTSAVGGMRNENPFWNYVQKLHLNGENNFLKSASRVLTGNSYIFQHTEKPSH
ncbi:hypothetical protein C8J57DRAFT_138892 [Mycena rebaudengoi]|nr:hypothetical protein C8J57DRAFT_138892 [Mycena rebaudengoi]